jgi:hypothetical protein
MVSLPDLDCILCVLCCVFYVVLFFYVMVQFSVILYSFYVLLYLSVLLCCSLLFILLCSSSCYVCVLVCIYCTLTLPPGVNPIAVNKYLSNNTLCRVQTTQRPVCTVQLNFNRHL